MFGEEVEQFLRRAREINKELWRLLESFKETFGRGRLETLLNQYRSVSDDIGEVITALWEDFQASNNGNFFSFAGQKIGQPLMSRRVESRRK